MKNTTIQNTMHTIEVEMPSQDDINEAPKVDDEKKD